MSQINILNLSPQSPGSPESLESIVNNVQSFFRKAVPSIPYLSVNVIISLVLITTFLTLFFFTYVKTVEKKIVIKNVNYLVSNLGDTILPILPEEIKVILYRKLDSFILPDMSAIDDDVEKKNNVLLNISFKLTVVIIIFSSIISYLLCTYFKLDFVEIFMTNFFLLFAVIATEYVFLNSIIFNWISADPNQIKAQIIKSIGGF